MKQLLPDINVPKLTKDEIKVCLASYFKDGAFPKNCFETHMAMSIDEFRNLEQEKARKLVVDVHKSNGKIAILRVDSLLDAKYVENFDVDMIWTDRIDVVGPLVTFKKIDSDILELDKKTNDLKKAFAKIPINPNDKSWVKKKLSYMVEADQYMRKYPFVIYDHKYTDKERRYFWSLFGPRMRNLDIENTESMKALLRVYDWINVSTFDEESDKDAWLLVQHADHDPGFQAEVLKKLEILYIIKETSPRNYAFLFDRVAASWNDKSKRKPQRFGTQGICIAPGKWEPIQIEDPMNVDIRRSEVGLGPLQEYINGFKEICK